MWKKSAKDAQAESSAGSLTWSRRYGERLSVTGAVVAAVLFWLSLTPSLLPRGPVFQGIVAGAAAAIGYGLGVFAGWLARYLLSRQHRWGQPRQRWWLIGAASWVLVTGVMLLWFQRWQDELRDLMGVQRLSWHAYPLILVIAAVVAVVLVLAGQGWGDLVSRLSGALTRVVPARVAAASAVLVVIVATVLVLNGVVARGSMAVMNSAFAAANNETTASSQPSTSPLRSGGPGSLVSWDSLGREGRTFVSHGPDVGALNSFTGGGGIEPIRAFVGLGSGDDLRANAELAADEMVRAGGLQRAVVAVGSATGSGWVNRATVDSLEYMYNGDVATVVIQYSYLPSWLSFLVDKERARQAGSALFEAIDERVQQVPEAHRPKVVVFGESLGSFGAEAAFGTVPTIAARTDGALLSGPTFNNSLWRDATNGRDPGSPAWLPIYDDGRHVRFITGPADLARPQAPWSGTRVVYLQHASDPIAWWSPTLVLNKPDWLRERRGRDVLDSVTWIPFVTFLQVSADMAVAVDVPDGHGHDYLSAIPHAWAAILHPPGWSDDKTEALLPRLTRD